MEISDRQYPIGGGKIQNVEWLRVIAVLSLVFWHSICVYTGWRSYLPNITYAVGDSIFTKFYILVAKVFLPDANMPLFTAISGFVYYYLRFYKSKYVETKSFLRNKIKRLMIPYFVIGTIVVFTIYDWSPTKVIYGDAHHLWYCAMLFWCFVGIRIYEKMPRWMLPLVVTICIASGFMTIPVDFLYIYRSLHYFPYFLVGYYLVSILPTIQSKPRYIMCVVFVAVSLLLLSLLKVKYVSTLAGIGYTYAYPIVLFSVIPINIKSNKLISIISSYSFGIYVFHEWILWNAAHLEVLEGFIIKNQILYPFIMYISVILISMVCTNLCLKCKVGRFLLGG